MIQAPRRGETYEFDGNIVYETPKTHLQTFHLSGIGDRGPSYITATQARVSDSTAVAISLWIVDKSELYDEDTLQKEWYDVESITGVFHTPMPAQLIGTPPSNANMFLLQYGGTQGGGGEVVTVLRIDNPLAASPTFSVLRRLASAISTKPNTFPKDV